MAQQLAAETLRSFGEPALYRAGGQGAGVAVTVSRVEGDQEMTIGGGRVAVSGVLLEVLRAEVATPAEGDTLELTDRGETRRVKGAPALDDEGVVWRLDSVPVA